MQQTNGTINSGVGNEKKRNHESNLPHTLTLSGTLVWGGGSVFLDEKRGKDQPLFRGGGGFSTRGPWARSTMSLLSLEPAESSLTGLTCA